jgi:ABC-type dipeptide/oligopeptide/nickel transport system permease subunit
MAVAKRAKPFALCALVALAVSVLGAGVSLIFDALILGVGCLFCLFVTWNLLFAPARKQVHPGKQNAVVKASRVICPHQTRAMREHSPRHVVRPLIVSRTKAIPRRYSPETTINLLEIGDFPRSLMKLSRLTSRFRVGICRFMVVDTGAGLRPVEQRILH